MFDKDDFSAVEAQYEAQRIAFGPVVFQAARCLVKFGILDYLHRCGDRGADAAAVARETGISRYGATVLLEMGLGARIVYRVAGDRFGLSKVGLMLIKDDLTRVNMDFVHDVCYAGMAKLDEAIATGRPAGLSVFGRWKTIYEALAHLPEPVRRSWFAFDHYYSDLAFGAILRTVFARRPARLMDIGANTGKWTLQCLRHDPQVHVTMVDLPGQLDVARAAVAQAGFQDRVTAVPHDILDDGPVPADPVDAVWMSQFLDCFSEEEIVHILGKVRAVLAPGAVVWVLETFWDRQRFEAAAFSLQATSLYFTAMANGNSRMYHSAAFLDCAAKAGFSCAAQHDGIGVAHTLLQLVPA